MHRPISTPKAAGFSLVELLVALLFTGILMAGMATVFRSSISTFTTSAEGIASARRNRLAMDMLQEDINAAGTYLVNVNLYPKQLTASNPGFYILPNQKVRNDAGSPVNSDALPRSTDELYMYMDSSLPGEGRLVTAIQGLDEMKAASLSPEMPAGALTFTIAFDDPSVAAMVKPGQFVILKDWLKSKLIQTATVSGTQVVITPDPNPEATSPGCGASYYDQFSHVPGARVLVANLGRMVRYRIKAKQLDPNGGLVPCLVREELAYNPAADAGTPTTVFPLNTPDQIIATDVSEFKVFLSLDGGQNWAGSDVRADEFATGWTAGILAKLQEQAPTGMNLTSDLHWFREVPTLVRVDLKTRTATQRSEYLTDGQTNVSAGFKDRQESFVIMPRHSGLPY